MMVELINNVLYGEPDYEIIGGEKFFMAAAAPNLTHGIIVSKIAHIFWAYIEANDIKSLVFGDNVDVYFSNNEHYMPDVSVVCNFEIIGDGKRLYGAPDLIVEVMSDSTMKNDIGIKKDTYEKYGVKEYWIVDPWSKRIEVYHNIDGRFKLDDVYKTVSDDENIEVKTQIKVSIFDDLIVDICNIFKWYFN